MENGGTSLAGNAFVDNEEYQLFFEHMFELRLEWMHADRSRRPRIFWRWDMSIDASLTRSLRSETGPHVAPRWSWEAASVSDAAFGSGSGSGSAGLASSAECAERAGSPAESIVVAVASIFGAADGGDAAQVPPRQAPLEREIGALSNAELLALALRAAGASRALDGLIVALAGAVSARGDGGPDSLWRQYGSRNAKLMLGSIFGVGVGKAAAWLALAEDVTARTSLSGSQAEAVRPALAASIAAGEISFEQAEAIHRTLPRPGTTASSPGEDLNLAAEMALIAAATGRYRGTTNEDDLSPAETLGLPEANAEQWRQRYAPHLLKAQAELWKLAIDPDGAEPAAAEQHHNRSLRLTQMPGGAWKIAGYAPALHGAAIQTLFDAYQAPRSDRVLPVDPGPDGHGGALRQGAAVSAAEIEAGAQECRGIQGAGEVQSRVEGSVDARGQAGSEVSDILAGSDRSRDQLAYDVFFAMVLAHAKSGAKEGNGGGAPTLLVTTTLEALTSYLGGEQTSPSTGDHRHGSGSTPLPHNSDGTDALETEAREWSLPVDWSPPWGGTSSTEAVSGSGWGIHSLIDRAFASAARSVAPSPISEVVHMICNDALQLLVLDEDGHPLKLGRARRLFTRHQRKALAARDRRCRAPQCDIPAGWCEAHHVRPWSSGGPSDLGNGIMLCSFHHHEVHAGKMEIEPSATSGEVLGALRSPWHVLRA